MRESMMLRTEYAVRLHIDRALERGSEPVTTLTLPHGTRKHACCGRNWSTKCFGWTQGEQQAMYWSHAALPRLVVSVAAAHDVTAPRVVANCHVATAGHFMTSVALQGRPLLTQHPF
jgi:hypothetical protein